jgi:AcrR family transcriptional regulator
MYRARRDAPTDLEPNHDRARSSREGRRPGIPAGIRSVDGRTGREASDRRRNTLITSALECFTEVGYEGTTVSDIIRRAGATTGTFYHYFPHGKAQVAAAVQLEALADYQEGSLHVLEASRGAREGIQAGVRHHLQWVQEHRSEAQFLFSDHPGEVWTELDDDLRELNRRYFDSVDRWLARHVEVGLLRPLPRPVAYALLVGPAQQLGRQYVRGLLPMPLSEAAELLAEGAWQALRQPPEPTASIAETDQTDRPAIRLRQPGKGAKAKEPRSGDT